MHGKVLIFDTDDYLKLRSEFHMIGKLIGIPVSHPRNLAFSSLPASYDEYEVQLLIEQGIVCLEAKTLNQPPNQVAEKEYVKHQDQVVRELSSPYIKSRLDTMKSNLNNIIKGKKRKIILSGVSEEGKNLYLCWINIKATFLF